MKTIIKIKLWTAGIVSLISFLVVFYFFIELVMPVTDDMIFGLMIFMILIAAMTFKYVGGFIIYIFEKFEKKEKL